MTGWVGTLQSKHPCWKINKSRNLKVMPFMPEIIEKLLKCIIKPSLLNSMPSCLTCPCACVFVYPWALCAQHALLLACIAGHMCQACPWAPVPYFLWCLHALWAFVFSCLASLHGFSVTKIKKKPGLQLVQRQQRIIRIIVMLFYTFKHPTTHPSENIVQSPLTSDIICTSS